MKTAKTYTVVVNITAQEIAQGLDGRFAGIKSLTVKENKKENKKYLTGKPIVDLRRLAGSIGIDPEGMTKSQIINAVLELLTSLPETEETIEAVEVEFVNHVDNSPVKTALVTSYGLFIIDGVVYYGLKEIPIGRSGGSRIYHSTKRVVKVTKQELTKTLKWFRLGDKTLTEFKDYWIQDQRKKAEVREIIQEALKY